MYMNWFSSVINKSKSGGAGLRLKLTIKKREREGLNDSEMHWWVQIFFLSLRCAFGTDETECNDERRKSKRTQDLTGDSLFCVLKSTWVLLIPLHPTKLSILSPQFCVSAIKSGIPWSYFMKSCFCKEIAMNPK